MAGSNLLKLVEKVGWKVGDEIAIASTDYDGFHAEQRRITEITNFTDFT